MSGGDPMFVIVDDKTKMIAVSHGDSAFFDITFHGDIPEDGTNTVFTVKKEIIGRPAGKAVLQKYVKVCDGIVPIDLFSQDTNKIEPGDYLWDLRVLFSPREVGTPVVPSRFTVMEAVGDV